MRTMRPATPSPAMPASFRAGAGRRRVRVPARKIDKRTPGYEDAVATLTQELMGLLAGPDWRAGSERDLPGSVAATSVQ